MLGGDQIGSMLTVREVAYLLHIHTNTVRRWSDRGFIRAYRISYRGDRRFKREEITEFLAELRENRCNPQKVNEIHCQALDKD